MPRAEHRAGEAASGVLTVQDAADTPALPDDPGLHELARLEAGWTGRLPGRDDRWTWVAFDLAEFTRMLAVAAPLVPPGAPFLDAGCGIGTKLHVAKHRFGLAVHGIEIEPEYLSAAAELGVSAEAGDVRSFTRWGEYAIVYLSRPLKGDQAEAEFERMVHAAMAPGAVLIAVWAAVKPPWEIFDRRPFRGVWRKPPDGRPVRRLPPPPRS